MAGSCTVRNSACLPLLGYKDPAELLGKNMHSMMHHTRPDGPVYPNHEGRIYFAFRQCQGAHVDDEVVWRRRNELPSRVLVLSNNKKNA
jgi:PAS domain-containing protein